MITAVTAMGELTDRVSQAKALTQELLTRIDVVKRKVEQVERPKVLWVVQRDPLRVAGKETFINWIIETAGGENAIGPTLHQYPPISSEQVVIGQPDVIIELLMDNTLIETQMASARDFWQRYKTVPAVRDQRLHVVGGDLIGRLGPRICDGVELMARIIHPQLFPETQPDEM
jgi:iron complex transport system substrate-binding protein